VPKTNAAQRAVFLKSSGVQTAAFRATVAARERNAASPLRKAKPEDKRTRSFSEPDDVRDPASPSGALRAAYRTQRVAALEKEPISSNRGAKRNSASGSGDAASEHDSDSESSDASCDLPDGYRRRGTKARGGDPQKWRAARTGSQSPLKKKKKDKKKRVSSTSSSERVDEQQQVENGTGPSQSGAKEEKSNDWEITGKNVSGSPAGPNPGPSYSARRDALPKHKLPYSFRSYNLQKEMDPPPSYSSSPSQQTSKTTLSNEVPTFGFCPAGNTGMPMSRKQKDQVKQNVTDNVITFATDKSIKKRDDNITTNGGADAKEANPGSSEQTKETPPQDEGNPQEDLQTFKMAGRWFYVLEELGRGGFGSVFRLQSCEKPKEIFALKTLHPRSDQDCDLIMREIDMLSRLKGTPNVVKMHHWEMRPEERFAGILMECGEGTLQDLLKKNRSLKRPLGPALSVALLSQIASAVHGVHSHHLVHCDLKPANFVVFGTEERRIADFGVFCDNTSQKKICNEEEGEKIVRVPILKLIDFGLSQALRKECSKTQRETFAGTIAYCAPEAAYAGRETQPLQIGKPVDVWALGVLGYEFHFGRAPLAHLRPLVSLQRLADQNWEPGREVTKILEEMACERQVENLETELGPGGDLLDSISQSITLVSEKAFSSAQMSNCSSSSKCTQFSDFDPFSADHSALMYETSTAFLRLVRCCVARSPTRRPRIADALGFLKVLESLVFFDPASSLIDDNKGGEQQAGILGTSVCDDRKRVKDTSSLGEEAQSFPDEDVMTTLQRPESESNIGSSDRGDDFKLVIRTDDDTPNGINVSKPSIGASKDSNFSSSSPSSSANALQAMLRAAGQNLAKLEEKLVVADNTHGSSSSNTSKSALVPPTIPEDEELQMPMKKPRKRKHELITAQPGDELEIDNRVYTCVAEMARCEFGFVFRVMPKRSAADQFTEVPKGSSLTVKCMLARSNAGVEVIKEEIAKLKNLRNEPDVVHLYGSEMCEYSRAGVVVTEFGAGLLRDWLGRRECPVHSVVATQLFSQITGAVSSLHSRGIVHGCLKPSMFTVHLNSYAGAWGNQSYAGSGGNPAHLEHLQDEVRDSGVLDDSGGAGAVSKKMLVNGWKTEEVPTLKLHDCGFYKVLYKHTLSVL